MLRIQGPIPGGNVPPCAVLRCDAQGAYVATLMAFGDLAEALLCEEHKHRIDAGQRWQWDGNQNVFLMGDDLGGEGRLRATNFRVHTESDVDSELGADPVRVDIDGAGGTSLGFILSRDTAGQLGAMLTQFAGGDRDGASW